MAALVLLLVLPGSVGVAAQDSDSGITRTPRTGTDADEIPAASDGLQSFTGSVYGYTVSYDPAVWTLASEISEGNVDGANLQRDVSNFIVWGWDAYGSDPVMCLDGEIAYYSTEYELTVDWQPALGADGEPLRYESDDLAWAVFNATYNDDQGQTYQLVEYISCEPIPGQGAVLIAMLSTDPEAYNTELDLALDVLDTLEFGEAPVTDGTDGTDGTDIGVSTGEEVTIHLDGTEYTSPNYGFTAMIPLEWQILEESVDGTDDRLVVSNGTSIVTIWATQEHAGDLTGCVDFAANASGLNLSLDSDASGGDFRGVYRNEAFANFVYEDAGVPMMYFINCQAIPGTNAFLILIHDVEYEQFTAERRFRLEIENSISMP